MDYEKAYTEALIRAKEAASKGFVSQSFVEDIFPELKESEDDQIKRFINNELACLRANEENGSVRYELLTNAIAWIEKQGEQKPAWSEEDEVGFGDALWAIEQAKTIAKDENDMGNLWYAEKWLKSIKYRLKGK